MRKRTTALALLACVCLLRGIVACEPLYQESLRPQFHFTAVRNWLNDPNGLVYFDGEYHLFFQFNPYGNQWGNMTWGHAVSDDLVRWKQLDDAIVPDALGTIYSGSCVVDWQNTAGFQQGDTPALVAIYTAAGGKSAESAEAKFTQCLAFSNDRGRTWTKYRGNPVLPHVVAENRDPKVVWHADSRRWVMVLYLDGNEFALYSSPDLKHWTQTDTLSVPGSIECPDLFEMQVVECPDESKWIFWTANNIYLVGDFDGKKFAPTSGPQQFEHGANRFAAQTYSDIPATDGRRIQFAWMRGGSYPDMPFNQQMTFATELTLHATDGGHRLHSQPVAEIELLRGEAMQFTGELHDDENLLAPLSGDLYDMELTIRPTKAPHVLFDLRGNRIEYHVADEELRLGKSRVQVPLQNGAIRLRVLVDRTSIEVFANQGAASISNCFVPDRANRSYRLRGEGAQIETLRVWPLNSAWAGSAD